MITRNVNLRDHNTFRLHAHAAALAKFCDENDLRAIFTDTSLPSPFKAIGSGSNLILTGDFPGTILLSDNHTIRLTAEEGSDKVLLTAGAAVETDELCRMTAEKGLWGLENLSGIPGTAGAAPVQNVGAYGVEAGDLIVSATAFDTQTMSTVIIDGSEMQFGYRDSMFKHPCNRDRYIITDVTFRLSRIPRPRLDYGPLKELRNSGEEITPMLIRNTVLKIRDSKLPDVSVIGSAGSFFKNPVVAQSIYEQIASQYPGIAVPHYEVGSGLVKIPAAWLIDRAGMKGTREGGAAVWEAQPLVIVNATGEATASDVIALEKRIISSVNRKFGIMLTPEAEHLGCTDRSVQSGVE